VGGSVVYFKDNTWECSIDPDDAFNQARDSTVVATNIINIDTFNPPPTGIPVSQPPRQIRILPLWGLAYVDQ
jgi:hypothetical protein